MEKLCHVKKKYFELLTRIDTSVILRHVKTASRTSCGFYSQDLIAKNILWGHAQIQIHYVPSLHWKLENVEGKEKTVSWQSQS